MPLRTLGPSFIEKIRGLVDFGFIPPPFDGMQIYSRMKFLYNCVLKHGTMESGVALEIGCYKGCSTVFLAKACQGKGIRKISSMDLFTGTPAWPHKMDTFDEATQRLRAYGVSESVTLIRSASQDYAWQGQIDVLHIDADHEYQAVKFDLAKYAPFVTAEGIIIVDDYDGGHQGLKRAVDEFLENDSFFVADQLFGELGGGSICLKRKGVHVSGC